MTLLSQRSKLFAVSVTALVVLALTALRFVHLGADTPASIDDWGALVDEGYKTWSARNLAVFGSLELHPQDPYEGWMHSSPLTQWAYYLSFRVFGAEVESARIVTVAFFALFLSAYAWAMRPRYSLGLLLAGMLILGLESTIFFFSRIAIFEIPLSFFVYGLLFALARSGWRRRLPAVSMILAVGAVVSLTIKLSGAVYIMPIVVAAFAEWAAAEGWKRRGLLVAGVAAVGLFAVLLGGHVDTLSARLDLSLKGVLGRMLDNPAVQAAPALSAFGVFCAAHALLIASTRFRRDPYRLSLISLVLIGPLLLALFRSHPLRYYVPLLPAHILLALEWVQQRTWREPIRGLLRPSAIVGWLALSLALYQIIDGLLLVRLPNLFPDFTKVPVGVAAAAALTLASWRWRHRVLQGPVMRAAAFCALLFLGGRAVATVGAFLTEPAYRSEHIRQALSRAVESHALVAGDWAPFFALGTDLRPLYTRPDFLEDPLYFEKMRPSWYLYTETGSWTSDRLLETFREQRSVRLAEPLFRTTYAGERIVLYRLLYDKQPKQLQQPPLATPEGSRAGSGRSKRPSSSPAAANVKNTSTNHAPLDYADRNLSSRGSGVDRSSSSRDAVQRHHSSLPMAAAARTDPRVRSSELPHESARRHSN